MDSDARLKPPESPARGPSSELGRGPGYSTGASLSTGSDEESGTVRDVPYLLKDMADRKAIPCSVGHPVTGPARRATVLLQLFREQLEKKKQEAPAAALTPAQVPASSARAVRTLAMLAAASKHASWRSAARAQAETPADGGRAAGTEGDASSTGGSAAAESARQICRRRSPK